MLRNGGQGHRRINHLGAGLLSLVLLIVSLSGCTKADEPRPKPHGVTVGGPVRQVAPFEVGANRPPGNQLQDVYIAQLVNSSRKPVVLDEVQLQPDKAASRLRFGGAFVAPAGSNLHIASGHSRGLKPLKGYRLSGNTGAFAPVLVLRVGPASLAQAKGFPDSRNNSVNLWYHTLDGRRYVVPLPVQVEYPNESSGP